MKDLVVLCSFEQVISLYRRFLICNKVFLLMPVFQSIVSQAFKLAIKTIIEQPGPLRRKLMMLGSISEKWEVDEAYTILRETEMQWENDANW